MDGTPVIRSFEALMSAETEVVEGFLMAAVYCRALHDDTSPRDVLDALWKAMPSANAWPALREALVASLVDGRDG
jgi:hypothetical protein